MKDKGVKERDGICIQSCFPCKLRLFSLRGMSVEEQRRQEKCKAKKKRQLSNKEKKQL